jgi:hypothetical protein
MFPLENIPKKIEKLFLRDLKAFECKKSVFRIFLAAAHGGSGKQFVMVFKTFWISIWHI